MFLQRTLMPPPLCIWRRMRPLPCPIFSSVRSVMTSPLSQVVTLSPSALILIVFHSSFLRMVSFSSGICHIQPLPYDSYIPPVSWFGGATPTPREVGPLLCTITLPEKEYKKAEGLTKMKGAFLVMNESERAGYIRRCKELLGR